MSKRAIILAIVSTFSLTLVLGCTVRPAPRRAVVRPVPVRVGVVRPVVRPPVVGIRP